MKLERHYVEKPWGRLRLPPMFDAPEDRKIGEIWFTNGADLPLLAKYIFTSERLSIQVHPDDDEARARGLPHGKSECWYVLDAEPGSVIGLGLTTEVSPEELRATALNGSIDQLLDWKPVRAGDFFFVPGGTIHAIGGGLSLLEFQQNLDLTYRLYDYGRPRELHLDEAIAVADLRPYPPALARHLSGDEERMLVDGPHFRLVQTGQDAMSDSLRWVIPLRGEVRSGAEVAGSGECLLLKPGEALESDNALMLIGARA
jgi:mannose-6-phosphate isomerase